MEICIIFKSKESNIISYNYLYIFWFNINLFIENFMINLTILFKVNFFLSYFSYIIF